MDAIKAESHNLDDKNLRISVWILGAKFMYDFVYCELP